VKISVGVVVGGILLCCIVVGLTIALRRWRRASLVVGANNDDDEEDDDNDVVNLKQMPMNARDEFVSVRVVRCERGVVAVLRNSQKRRRTKR
jgi:hypothetical protein